MIDSKQIKIQITKYPLDISIFMYFDIYLSNYNYL